MRTIGLWLKNNWLALLGNLLIWAVPLASIFALYFKEDMGGYAFELTGILVGIVIVLIYTKALKQNIRDGKLASKIKSVNNTSHPIWRVIQLFIYGVEMGIAYLFTRVMVQLGGALQYYILVVGIVGILGYVLLVINDTLKLKVE